MFWTPLDDVVLTLDPDVYNSLQASGELAEYVLISGLVRASGDTPKPVNEPLEADFGWVAVRAGGKVRVVGNPDDLQREGHIPGRVIEGFCKDAVDRLVKAFGGKDGFERPLKDYVTRYPRAAVGIPLKRALESAGIRNDLKVLM